MSKAKSKPICPECDEPLKKTRIKCDPITLQEYYYEWYCQKCNKYFPLIQVR